MLICSFRYKVIPNLSFRLLTLKHTCNVHCQLLRPFPGCLIYTQPMLNLLFSISKEKSSHSGIMLAVYVDSDKLQVIFNPPKWVYASSNARWKTGWYCILGQYVLEKGQIRIDIDSFFFTKKYCPKIQYLLVFHLALDEA